MQQQKTQYHGIASYVFAYKLSTASSWTTAKTTNTTNIACEYTFTGLTSEKKYDLRVVVKDRANNSSTGTNKANTTRHENNPGGTITNITSTEIILPGAKSALITDNIGKTINYTFDSKTLLYSKELSGTGTRFDL